MVSNYGAHLNESTGMIRFMKRRGGIILLLVVLIALVLYFNSLLSKIKVSISLFDMIITIDNNDIDIVYEMLA